MLRYDHGGDIYGNGEIKLDFSVNTNPLGMPEGVKRAVISHAEDYARYPDPRCRALTAAIAAHHGLSPEMVLCGNGAADLIFRICACLRPERILLPAPAFSEYERAATTFGGTVWEYPFPEEYGFAFPEGFAEAITLGPGGGLPGANGFDLVFRPTTQRGGSSRARRYCGLRRPAGKAAPCWCWMSALSISRRVIPWCRSFKNTRTS